MGKLILTSSGYIDINFDSAYAQTLNKEIKNKNILLINNATTTGSNIQGAQNAAKNIKKLAKNVIIGTINQQNADFINNFDVLYICGGDIGPLLELNTQCNLNKIFSQFLKQGKTIIGESAGSMIFGTNLKYIYDIKKGTNKKYNIRPTSYHGINLVDINFFSHFNKVSPDLKQKILDYEKTNNLTITPVEDGQYLLFKIN